MFNNPFLKKDPLLEAVKAAQADGDMRRQAEAIVNEEFGVYSRKAVVREELAAYDAALEETYTALKEGAQIDEISRTTLKSYVKKADRQANNLERKAERNKDKPGDTEKMYKRIEGANLARDKMKVRVAANEEKANDGNLANNYPPYDKVTRGDVIAGATGKDQMGGKRKVNEKKMWEDDNYPNYSSMKTRSGHMMDSDVVGGGSVTKDNKPVVSPTAPKADTSGPSASDKAALTSKIKSMNEAVSRKHFQQVADLIKGHESQEKRNELASHHAGVFAKQNPRFNAAKFHAAAGSTAHQEPKKMEEAAYSAKAARAGKDIGKPGKMFSKIASKAGEKYGKERGEKVAGAILKKIRAKHMKEDQSF